MIRRDTTALLFGDKLFIVLMQGTESIPAPTNQMFELRITDDPCFIGFKVREALYGFFESEMTYGKEEWKKIYEQHVSLLGFKSMKILYDNVKIVNIYSRDSVLSILPYKNCGYNKAGTTSLDDQVLRADLETITDCDLGLLLIKGFERATLEL